MFRGISRTAAVRCTSSSKFAPKIIFTAALQEKLSKRAEEHTERDLQRDLLKDRSAYVNGVLFGFDPDLPLHEQSEGWRESVTPTPEDLADDSKRAARAWNHVERRYRGENA